MSELAEPFSVYVFGLLGFGASEKRPGQDVSLAADGARLAALLESLALDRPATSLQEDQPEELVRLLREHLDSEFA